MNRIKEVRKMNRMSQDQLAKILHVHQTAISQWEIGKTEPDINNLRTMANLFHVTTDYLLGRDEPVPPPTLDEQLSDIDFALSVEIRDLTDDEKKDILDYVRFKRSQKKGR